MIAEGDAGAGGAADGARRPSPGPLFTAALAAWAGCLVAEELSWSCYVRPEALAGTASAALPAAAALGVVLVIACRRVGALAAAVRALRIAGVAFACAAVCASLYWAGWGQDVDRLREAIDGGTVIAELTGDPAEREYGTVSAARVASGLHVAEFRLIWPQGTQPLYAGACVAVGGSLRVPQDDEGGRWNHRNGYVGSVKARSVEAAGRASGLRGLVAGFRDESFARIGALGGEQAGLMAGVLLGNRTLYAGTELEQAFQTTGLAHLMAVSGTHLAVVSALLGWALGLVRARRLPRACMLAAFLLLYTALTAFAPSAVRACVMCAAALAAGLAGRRAHVTSALCACAVGFIALHPPVAFSLGFQLSVFAVLGLALFAPLVGAWLERALPGACAKLAEPLAASLAATLPTLALTVPLFAQFPLIGPIATILAAPLVTAVLGAGLPALCLCAFLPAVGGFVLGCAAVPAGACCALVHALAGVPGACVPLDSAAPALACACALAMVLLWACWPLPAQGGGTASGVGAVRAAVVLAVPLAVLLVSGLGGVRTAGNALPAFESSSQVVMLDVGQGDAMLVRSGTAAVLVDTGEDGTVLKRALARNGVVHLDAVFVTHKDKDHCGALPDLAGVVGVDHVFVHADLLGYEGERQVLESARRVTGGRGAEDVRPGDACTVGEFTLTLLAPEDGGTSENSDSLVNLLEYDSGRDGSVEARGLLTGDAEEDAIASAVEHVGDVDFVKVGHHGSAGAFNAGQLAVLKPEVALIGVGLGNEYGHPTASTLGLLEDAGAKVYRTDLDGDITVSLSADRLGVTVQNGYDGQAVGNAP